MATLTIELLPKEEQRGFNLRRWAELLQDPEVARIEGRVETDRHGHVIMSPPPAASHGSFQFEIGRILAQLMPEGRVLTKCPISTADGVKAADVAWASVESIRQLGDEILFQTAPEICVEVLSPGNTDREIREKIRLYFDAGAQEVWTCDIKGRMTFQMPKSNRPLKTSRICPKFPAQIQLR